MATLVSPRMQSIFDDFVFEDVVRGRISVLRCRRLQGGGCRDELVVANEHLVLTLEAPLAMQLRRVLLRLPCGAILGPSQEGSGIIVGG